MAINYWHALTRRKRNEATVESQLARVLNLFDLTALGVGSTLGLGVYVLAGSVAYNQAGPAVIISFLIAAIASTFAGLCYAEFAARVPKAGSAYVYSYVSVGEFVAFSIGWNLILEYVIGTSSVARGLSIYLDSLFNNTMSKTMRNLMPINIPFLADSPDFFAFSVIMLLTFLLAFGVKESTRLNNIFTLVNMITIAIILIAGSIKANPANWVIAKEDIPSNVKNGGEGGFMPFGIAGVMAGAAKCFYGFVGFDCVATTGEEAINPKRNIPISIGISLIIIFISYFGVSVVLTMMLPYYQQNPDAPFPYAFDILGLIEIKWIVTIGAIFALFTSLIGGLFPLPRVLYAMAYDGLIFKFLSNVHLKTKTPLKATIISGFLAAIMAALFSLQQLIDMMSIGTLLAYTMVAMCVLVLRYSYENNDNISYGNMNITTIIKHLLNLNCNSTPNTITMNIAKAKIIIFCILTALACILFQSITISIYYPFNLIIFIIIIMAIIFAVFVLARQPMASEELNFKVPLVPFIPCLSIFINIYLMFQLDSMTWIRFLIWLIFGYMIYFFYGIKHSMEGIRNLKEKQANIDNIKNI